jgi:hypothetical protein
MDRTMGLGSPENVIERITALKFEQMGVHFVSLVHNARTLCNLDRPATLPKPDRGAACQRPQRVLWIPGFEPMKIAARWTTTTYST